MNLEQSFRSQRSLIFLTLDRAGVHADMQWKWSILDGCRSAMLWPVDLAPRPILRGRIQANTMGQNTCQNQNNFPNLGMAKNKVKKSGMFLATTRTPVLHHDNHAFHHRYHQKTTF
jgi:hypothetical protein